MIIECHRCKARVDADVEGMVEEPDEFFGGTRTYLYKCPSCNAPLVGVSDEVIADGKDGKWSEPVRVYPEPRRVLSSSVPKLVRESIEEAEKCMQIGAFIGAVAMVGRALEAVCRHFSADSVMLGKGVKDLRDKGLIDNRLYEWSEQLHLHRNIASHATEHKITGRDAADLLTFTYAIVDYLFELTEKFNAFRKRKEAEAKRSSQHPAGG